MNYQKFNCNEILTTEDLTYVEEAIKNLEENGHSFTPLKNCLYRLKDGYLYEGIDKVLYQVLDFKVFCNLVKTLSKITDNK